MGTIDQFLIWNYRKSNLLAISVSVNNCLATVEATKEYEFCKAESSLAQCDLYINSAIKNKSLISLQSYFVQLPKLNWSIYVDASKLTMANVLKNDCETVAGLST